MGLAVPDDGKDKKQAVRAVATAQDDRLCPVCNAELSPKQIYCSDHCRYVAWDKKHPRKHKIQKRKRRTSQQNRALHLWFSQIAESLNDSGHSVAKTLRHDVEIPWNGTLVKELIYRPVMQAMTGNKSTTELNTKDPSEIFEVLNRHLGEKLEIHIPWPGSE